MNDTTFTYFASAERSLQDEILEQHRFIADKADLVVVLNNVTSMVCVLNKNRQIVFAGRTALNKLGLTDMHQALGKRIGELFGCRHALVVNGCGTSKHCNTCGVTPSILESFTEQTSIEECSLTNDDAKITLDLRIHSASISVFDRQFVLCSLYDISNEKRRGVMERIFFHDLMNTVNGIKGITQVFDIIDVQEQPTYISYLTILVNSLMEQIDSHRVLTMAEKDEYQPKQQELCSLDFVVEEMKKYKQLAEQDAKEIRIADLSENHLFVSDKTLLSRVLDNMIKNALEAEQRGAVIEVGVRKDADGHLHFWVHNDSVMSENNKLQMFNRSFSTKGSNRGLGTYSMKLLTEKYLKGTIEFSSNDGEGTIFTAKIPV